MRESQLKILQYIAGIALFFLVGTHFIVTFVLGEPSSWEAVSGRAASAGWLAFYVLFLVFGLYHGIHGLRTIILELPIPKPPAKLVDGTLVLAGIAIFGYAVYIPINALLTP